MTKSVTCLTRSFHSDIGRFTKSPLKTIGIHSSTLWWERGGGEGKWEGREVGGEGRERGGRGGGGEVTPTSDTALQHTD